MNTSTTIRYIDYQHQHAESAVTMWRASKGKALGIAEQHSFEDHLNFLKFDLAKNNQVCLAVDEEENVLGLMVMDSEFLNQLYVHVEHQGKGIGTQLLNRAKENSNGSLKLYTFELNKKAQHFYEAHGFKIIGGGSDNEEQLPDLLLQWKV